MVGYSSNDYSFTGQKKRIVKRGRCSLLFLFNLSPPQFLNAYDLGSFISLSPDGKRLAVRHGIRFVWWTPNKTVNYRP